MIPGASDRVTDNTSDHVNETIRQATRVKLASHAAAGPAAVAARLAALEHEWDLERVMGLVLGTAVLAGLAMNRSGHQRGVLLAAAAAASLVAHASHGWSPLLGMFRRLGFRTAQEIQEERQALKALRGDFRVLSGSGPITRQSLDQAIAIVRY